jgi:CRISPR-associated endoribonuclease Cas6
MRIQIEFELSGKTQLLPFNYQYPLSSWIYKVIDKGNAEFATFLHEQGYTAGDGKRFKLFCFSGLRFPGKTAQRHNTHTSYLSVRARKAYLDISFFLPEQLEPFVAGLFQAQDAVIGDKQFQLNMKVRNVQMLPEPDFSDNKIYHFRTKTAVVLSEQVDGETQEQYIVPLKPSYTALMQNSILDKCRAVGINGFSETDINFTIEKLQAKTNLQSIKAGTAAETKVKAYYYDFKLKAPAEVLKLVYASGIGSMNSLGFGLVEVRRRID